MFLFTSNTLKNDKIKPGMVIVKDGPNSYWVYKNTVSTEYLANAFPNKTLYAFSQGKLFSIPDALEKA